MPKPGASAASAPGSAALSRRACLAGALGCGAALAWRPGALAAATPGVAWPQQLELEYEISARYSSIAVPASGQLRWQASAASYESTLAVRIPLLGGRTQRSRGRLLPEGLQPAEFSDQTRRMRHLELDWHAMRYRHRRDGQDERSGALQSGAQDRLSLFFQLAWQLNRGTVRADSAWTVPVLSAAGVEPWLMRVRGLETIDTPAGALQAWRVERHTSQAQDSRLSLWLAERLHHLPARILLQEPDGDQADQRLKRLPWA